MNSKNHVDVNLPQYIQTRIDAIRHDTISGSADLAERGVELLQLLLQDMKVSSVDVLKKSLEQTGLALVTAQPEMALLFSLVNGLLLELDPLEEVEEIQKDGNLFCQRFLLRIKGTPHCIGAYLLDELRKCDTLLLHSYSSTVLKVLLYAKREGCSFSVVCTESRPAYEGILLAKNLAANNINVTLVTDAAIGSMLPTVDCTLVGVDAITKEGVWNKTGTMGILLSSWTLHIPSYTICGIEKILPERYSPTYRQRDPQELLSEPLDKVQPFNYYFDRTPWKYIQHVITNEGPLSVSAIQKRMKALKLHHVFTSLVKT